MPETNATSTATPCGRARPSPSAGGRCGVGVGAWAGAGCGLGRLVRRLRKQGRMLRSAGGAARPAALRCQYDPLSYARNFDRSGFGTAPDDDSTHFYNYTFSSRFVLASSSSSSQQPDCN